MAVVWAVVVAGGAGTRFGRPKQFAVLAGRPVVAWAVEGCRSVAASVVLVLPAGPEPDGAAGDAPERYGADVVVTGGATRSESVRRGLAAVPEEAEVVVVHDAARPLATAESFRAVVAALGDGEAAGAVCALPAADTLKRVDRPLDAAGSASVVVETLDRHDVVVVQTPQAFRAEALRRAHAAAPTATDDAAVVEAAGGVVRVVSGDPRNLKLTTPSDLAYAEQVLSS